MSWLCGLSHTPLARSTLSSLPTSLAAYICHSAFLLCLTSTYSWEKVDQKIPKSHVKLSCSLGRTSILQLSCFQGLSRALYFRSLGDKRQFSLSQFSKNFLDFCLLLTLTLPSLLYFSFICVHHPEPILHHN